MGIINSYLEFIQKNFNTGDVGYDKLIDNLIVLKSKLVKDKSNSSKLRQVENLISKRDTVGILKDTEMFNRVNDITSSIDISKSSINKVLRLTDRLIYDIKNTRGWLDEYNRITTDRRLLDKDKLVLLGTAILARAVELCPIDTGVLRSSGVLLIYDSYVVVAFTAPYAIYVNEDMNNRHTVGGAKFLERAVQQILPDSKTWIDIASTVIEMVKIGGMY